MLNVTQQALSEQLRELESHLGVKLLERSEPVVDLTQTGESIAVRARTILHDVQDLLESVKRNKSPFDSTIRLGVLQSIGPYLLPHIVPQLQKAYPNFRLYVREALPDALLQSLDEGRLDLILFPLPVRNNNLDSISLFEEPLWIVVPKEHRLAANESISLSDIKGETVLTLERGHRLHDQVRDLCNEFDANLSYDYEGTSLDTIRMMVGMGMGIAFLPALYVTAEALGDDQIIARQLLPRAPSRKIGMMWPRRSAYRDEFNAFSGLIRGILEAQAPEISIMY